MRKFFKVPEDTFLTKELLHYFIEESGGANVITKILLPAFAINALRRWSGREAIVSEHYIGLFTYKNVAIPVYITTALPEYGVEVVNNYPEKSIIEISVSGEKASGKSTVVALLYRLLHNAGFDVGYDYPECSPQQEKYAVAQYLEDSSNKFVDSLSRDRQYIFLSEVKS